MRRLERSVGFKRLEGFFIAVLLVLMVLVALCAGALVSSNKAMDAMHDAGYTNIEVVDHDWFAAEFKDCNHDAISIHRVTAYDQGAKVAARVCVNAAGTAEIRR